METDRLSYLLRHEATAHGKEDYKHLAADALESLSAEVESLRAELAEWKATTPALKPDCRTCGYFEWRVYECWFESSNPNRLCVDGSEHLHADPVRLYEKEEKL